MLQQESGKNIGQTTALIIYFLTFRINIANCILKHQGYIQLNRYLTTSIQSMDIHQNLYAINEKLKDFIACPPLQIMYSDLIIALQEIDPMIKLPHLECTSQELEIFRTLADRTDSHRYYEKPESYLTRLELIIYHASVMHALRCLPIYQDRFHHLHSTWLVERPNDFVERFMTHLTVKAPKKSVMIYHKSLLHREDLNLQSHSIYAAYHIKSLATPQELLSPDAVPLINVYLNEPCRQFNNHFGPDLFDMVLFDEQMFQDLSDAYLITFSGLKPYLIARATYLTCKAILNSEDFTREVLSAYRAQNQWK